MAEEGMAGVLDGSVIIRDLKIVVWSITRIKRE